MHLIGHIKGNKVLLFTALFIFILRLIFIGAMGLMPQDAYYYFYGEHPALSYYDHPPAIAWLLKAFTTILGNKAYAVKLADSVTTFATLIAFYQLCLHFLSRHKAANAFIVLFSTLMVTILSLVSTPDVPLMLCWTLSLLFLYRAVFLERKVYWLLAGIMMGLAFDSKYTAVFLPAGLLLFLVLSAPHRKWLLSPWLWAALILMIVASSPVIIWNIQHDMASFRFQSTGRTGGIEVRPLDVLGVIGHQAAILMPVLFFSLWVLLYKTIRRKFKKVTAEQLFLLSFFLPLFLLFFLISPIYWVKINWMMPAYISGIIWVSVYLSEKYIRWQQVFAWVVHVALAIELIFYPVPINSDDVWLGWGEMADSVKSLKKQYPQDFIFSADDYKTSAVLNFYLDEMVYGQNILGRKALQFDYIGTDVNKLAGRNALFINSEIGDATDEQRFTDTLRKYFSTVQALPPIVVRGYGKVIREFQVYRCLAYHPGGSK
ncbi:glycosyltransferase family 39 protein [Chitinophaga niabensis]|uniref:ArnT family glycosyltransferase n=1 Tax=Chitinophaga niabensis TaxID=536979 RepID=UPI0031B9EC3D